MKVWSFKGLWFKGYIISLGLSGFKVQGLGFGIRFRLFSDLGRSISRLTGRGLGLRGLYGLCFRDFDAQGLVR